MKNLDKMNLSTVTILKRFVSILLAMFAFASIVDAQISFDPSHYVTVWDSRLPSTRTDNDDTSIVINTHGKNYTVTWVLLDDSGNETSTRGTMTNVTNEAGNTVCKITVPVPGKYRIRAYHGVGELKYLYMYYSDKLGPFIYDNQKLLLVENWSNIQWKQMNDAFYKAKNMDVIATDVPDVSIATNFGSTFSGCSELKYANGKIKDWNVSNAVEMSWMFFAAHKFNGDLSGWRVDNVKYMRGMFNEAFVFTSDLSNWNVSSCKNMGAMFSNAKEFNSDLSRWNVSNVTDMAHMFYNAAKFNSDLSNWDVSKVTNMGIMFAKASLFNSDLSQWQVDNVTDMREMFNEATNFTSELKDWNVSKVTNMRAMFRGCTSFTSDLSGWKVGNVTDMYAMFTYCENFDSDLSQWDVSQVIDMEAMFYKNHKFKSSNLKDWKVGNVTNMRGMFYEAKLFTSDLSKWDVRNVINTKEMFYKAHKFTSDLSKWKVSKVTDMRIMFYEVNDFESDLSGWDVSRVNDMGLMFYKAKKFNSNLGDWNLTSLTNADRMFDGSGIDCKNYSATLVGWAKNPNTPTRNIKFTNQGRNCRYNRTGKVGRDILINKNGWTISGDIYDRLCGGEDEQNDFVTIWKTDNPSSRTGNTDTSIALNTIGAGYTVEWESVADPRVSGVVIVNSSSESDPYVLDLSSSTAGAGEYRIRAYSGFGSLTGLYMDNNARIFDHKKILKVEQWGNTQWENLRHAFYKAENMDVTATDKPNLSIITDLGYMFAYCYKLQYSNGAINQWNVENVTNMKGLFSNATLFNQNIGRWNTEAVTDMSFMFERAGAFNKEIDSWNTANVKNMNNMFYYSTSFDRSLNSWDVSKVISMKLMFYKAEKFNQSLDAWKLKALTNAENMFDYSGVDCFNYSTTLVGWADNTDTKHNITLGAFGLSYNSRGKVGHDKLENTNHWRFVGDNYDPFCGGLIKIWTGAISEAWDDSSNWLNDQKPEDGDDVEFATMANIGISVQNNLRLDNIRKIGRLVNETDKSLIIPERTSLTVNKMIMGSEKPDNVERIKILSSANNPNGSLMVLEQPDNRPVYATVNMYSMAKKEARPSVWRDDIPGSPTYGQEFKSYYKWQYFGLPVEEAMPNSIFYKSYIKEYDETYNGDNTKFYQKWRTVKSYDKLVAFKGYEITREQPTTYWIEGKLVFGDKQLTMTRRAPKVTGATNPDEKINHWGLGQNIFGNSYTASINIKDMIFPPEVEQTVYIYNTGGFADWAKKKNSTTSSEFITNGVYLAIPKNITSIMHGKIPSMQGFMLKFKDEETVFNRPDATVTLKYDNDCISNNSKPQKAPSSNGSENEVSEGYLQVVLDGAKSSDIMWLIEMPNTTDDFDNGYDGYKLSTGLASANIFTETKDGRLQVSTSNTIAGKTFSFRPNSDGVYKLIIVRQNLPHYQDLNLVDLMANKYISLNNDTTEYEFTSSNSGKVEKRFMIVNQGPTTGEDLIDNPSMDFLDAYITNNNMLIINNMTSSEGVVTVTDVSGRYVLSLNIQKGFTEVPVNLPLGVYIAAIKAGGKTKTVKIVLK
ncbi:MAG: BspA family leucine-rich repeat surface protein [Porphyromonadaceae bacterium]|nr:BspA family leucine-rich repeat surface protein [Porphyromonadaceae bacterium]